MAKRAAICVLVVAGGVSLARVAPAATTVAAGTYDTDTWTAAGSPYQVEGKVQFASLTIEAGAMVRVATAHPGWPDPNSIVVGDLVIAGTPDAPAVIEADTDAVDAWQGFVASGSVSVTGAVVRDAVTGLDIAAGARATVTRSVFESDTTGMGASSISGLVVDAVVFRNLKWRGILARASSARITNSVFQAANQAVFIENGTVTIMNCTFDGDLTAVDYINNSAPASVTLQNSVVTDTLNPIAYNKVGGAKLTIVNTDFWNSTQVFIADPVPIVNGLTVDPLYGQAGDLHLAAGSPCIDAGSADGAPDHDFDFRPRPRGAAVDMGAYEFDDGSGAGGAGGAGGAAGGSGGVTGGSGATTGIGGGASAAGDAKGGAGGIATSAGGSGHAGTSGVSGARATGGGGCGCSLGRSRDGRATAAGGLIAALAAFLRRRRRRRD